MVAKGGPALQLLYFFIFFISCCFLPDVVDPDAVGPKATEAERSLPPASICCCPPARLPLHLLLPAAAAPDTAAATEVDRALAADNSFDSEFERFKAAAEGGANLLPLFERVMADQLTPVLAYRCGCVSVCVCGGGVKGRGGVLDNGAMRACSPTREGWGGGRCWVVRSYASPLAPYRV